MFKLMGAFDIPVVDVNLGAFFSFVTGHRYNKNLLLPTEIDPDPVADFYENTYIGIYAEKKGYYTLPNRYNLDLRLQKFFKIGNIRVSAVVDIFNALNSDTVVDVETWDDPRSEFPFGYVWGIRAPRTFRVGFRAEF